MHNLKILFTVYLLNRTNALHDKMSQIQEFRIEEEKKYYSSECDFEDWTSSCYARPGYI